MKKRVNIAVLSLSLLTVMAGAAIAPALGAIQTAFPDVDPLQIKMIMTLPSFFIIPCSLMTSRMAHRFGKKRLILSALFFYLVGGMGGGIAASINQLLFFRGMMGIGVGFIIPLSTGLIADFYSGSDRTVMMGYSTAVNNLGGIIASIFSGFLATVNWRLSFTVYAMALLVLLLTLKFLREPSVTVELETKNHRIGAGIWKLALVMYFVSVIFYTAPMNMSLFISAYDLGEASMSGMLMSLLTLASFIVGLNFLKVTRFLREFKVYASLLLMMFGFVILSFTADILLMIIAMVCIGMGIGLLMPIIILDTAHIAPKHQSTFALAIVTCFMYLGQFSTPLFCEMLSVLMKQESARIPFYTSVLLSVVFILAMFINDICKRYFQGMEPASLLQREL